MIYALIALLISLIANVLLYREVKRLQKIVTDHANALTVHVQDTDADEENTVI